MHEIDIDGVPIHDVTSAEAVSLIADWARDGSGGYVYTPNVDDIVKARRDPAFRQAVLGARLRVPDGMGIVYGSRLLGTPLRATVTGRLLPAAVGAALGGKPPGIALFGGRPEVVGRARDRLAEGGALVTAAVSPPMGLVVGSSADAEVTEEIAAARPGVVFVSLGAPRQALWMARHASDLPHAVLVGVGGAVDVLAGAVPTPPRWMTRVGVEWLFRLANDPRRLAGRYLRDDPQFFRWMISQRRRRRR